MSLAAALLVMLGLVALAALAAAWAAREHASADEKRIARIEELLPQTQCGRCTYAGCRPYAEAIARGEAGLDQCPPGGARTAAALADLLGREARPVDPRYGHVPAQRHVAWIDEAACIGCTKCIQACPVDAIVGAARYMHTVIAADCTGCELCISPCPVDCIEMRPAAVDITHTAAHAARQLAAQATKGPAHDATPGTGAAGTQLTSMPAH